MSNAPRLDIVLYRNGSWSRTILLKEEDGSVKNLTGVTFLMQVKRSAGAPGAALGAGVVTITSAVLGEITIELLGTTFAAVAGVQDIVVLAYDLRMVEGTTPDTILTGEIRLTPGVSTP